MRELAHGIGIDIGAIERAFHVSRGFGDAYWSRAVEGGRPEDSILAATAFRRAAAHGVLLDLIRPARDLFGQATMAYLKAQHPYGAALANLADVEVSQFIDRERTEGPDDVFLLWGRTYLHAGLWHDSEGAIRTDLSAYRNTRVGVLGVPVSVLTDLRDAAIPRLEDQSISSEVLVHPLRRFLRYYSEALEQARLNRYYWRRLAMPFHAIEPDVFAVLSALEHVLMISKRSMLEDLPVDGLAREIIQEAFRTWLPLERREQ